MQHFCDDNEKLISQLIDRMSLRQKVGQLVQYGSFRTYEKELIQRGELGSLLNFCGATAVSEIQALALASPNPIPLLIGDDVIHGYHTGFPIPLAESCSFDLSLIEETAAAAAWEASLDGVNMIFAPMVDVARDPRWGRVAEGAGEDAWYGSLVAAARVKGFQRNDWEDRNHVTACPKHFVGYGASEGGRDYDYTEISMQTLWETYLPPFNAAIQAGAGAVMSAFNDVSGQPASLSNHLLENVLRTQLGFLGPVVTDWESVLQGVMHGVAEDEQDAVRIGISSGAEIDMNSGIYDQYLEKLVKEGKMSEERLNLAVRRVLRLKLSLNLLQNVIPREAKGETQTKDFSGLAGEMARKSIVLLKNQGQLLPLSSEIRRLAIIGPLADSKEDMLGCWQCKTDKERVTTPLAAIRKMLDGKTEITYFKGCGILDSTEEEMDAAVSGAQQADTVLMFLGEACWMSGENNSRAHLGLPGKQQELLKRVLKANKRVVLLLMNGRPLTISWEQEHVPAIVEAWQLGEKAGQAIAEVLFGLYNPSGKLTISFPRCEGQIPIYYNRRVSGRPELIRYIDDEVTPLYPFGFGLSYTSFAYGEITADRQALRDRETLRLQVPVTNTGSVRGIETVQMYIRDEVAGITRPQRQLKGFVQLALEPGETKTAEFYLTPDDLAYPSPDGHKILEDGWFTVYIGGDSTCTDKIRFILDTKKGDTKV